MGTGHKNMDGQKNWNDLDLLKAHLQILTIVITVLPKNLLCHIEVRCFSDVIITFPLNNHSFWDFFILHFKHSFSLYYYRH